MGPAAEREVHGNSAQCGSRLSPKVGVREGVARASCVESVHSGKSSQMESEMTAGALCSPEKKWTALLKGFLNSRKIYSEDRGCVTRFLLGREGTFRPDAHLPSTRGVGDARPGAGQQVAVPEACKSLNRWAQHCTV